MIHDTDWSMCPVEKTYNTEKYCESVIFCLQDLFVYVKMLLTHFVPLIMAVALTALAFEGLKDLQNRQTYNRRGLAMKWFYNLKIKSKLLVGFGAVLVLVAALVLYALIQVNSINTQYHDVINHSVAARDAILRAQSDARGFRRIVASTVMHAPTGNTAVINSLHQEGLALFESSAQAVNDYEQAVRTTPNLAQAYIDQRMSRAVEFRQMLNSYRDNIFMPVTSYALAGNHAAALAQVQSGEDIINRLVAVSLELAAMSDTLMDEQVNAAFNLADRSIYVLIAVSIAIFVISLILALSISRIISRPVTRLVSLTREVAAGNINVNVDKDGITNDEIGELTRDIYGLLEVVRGIVEDLTRINHEFNTNGDIDYRADASKYKNSFKQVMLSTNEIIESNVKDVLAVLTVLNQVTDGDFNVQISDLPGKKIVLPNTLRAVTANLKDIYDSVDNLAVSATKGRFDVELDPTKFKGSWADLTRKLNSLVTAVAEPLAAIETSLNEMKKGNFEDAKIEKTFKGTFENVKVALNSTEETTLSYISDIADILGRMAKGDLTVSINRDYIGSYAPIKVALNSILDSLKRVMTEIATASDQVLTGAEQLSQSAMHLADGSARQTASIEELTASMETINHKAAQSAASATEASERALRSSEFATQGEVKVQAMLSTMDKLKESSESIGKVIKVISDIAFQTNLLALNAAVEAARAGEHGKGFAVVADEVRNLAGRSQTSTNETTAIIEEDVQMVGSGVNAARSVAESFTTIMDDISQISETVAQINEMSKEQVESIAVINDSVGEISRVIQDNSATAEESAAASQELNSQAETLKQLVSFFKLKK